MDDMCPIASIQYVLDWTPDPKPLLYTPPFGLQYHNATIFLLHTRHRNNTVQSEQFETLTKANR
ncbi:hypothetical protein OE88DRAFT_1651880 [Heliocybe sulcata]|uniref:Uncharacterized protein n=1 Tax=Heliocybe sulcata TaxID=5364 RepID=A0A5C3NDW8_9AGAM|nr:hypothetical protein OE88DRAFT_1651880 [Heliocybe sulcata]